MKLRSLIVIVLVLLVAHPLAFAQAWSGILSPSRAIDWSYAGIPGGIPARTSICANVSTSDTTAQIQAKIDACPQDGVVKFPAGTWTLTSSLHNNRGGVVLRGSGPTKTKIILGSGTNIFLGISGTSGQGGYPPEPYVAVNWTGGLSKGDSVLTVASTSGMKVGQTVILDQHNNPDLVFITGTEGTQGGGRDEQPSFNTAPGIRVQFQMAEITQVNDSTHITVSPPVDYTHDPALAPQVMFWNPNGTPYPGNIRYAGVENLKVDANHQNRAIVFTFCSYCWVRNVEVDNTSRGAITTWFTYRNEIRDSYISAAGALAGPTQYGFEIIESPYTKLENNISFNITSQYMPMDDDALVLGYNYMQHIYGPDNQLSAIEPHQSHSYLHLYEGNVTYSINIDNVWGSASQLTLFRNYSSGVAPNKTNFRTPLVAGAHQRYMNYVGNVLGTVGYHAKYQEDYQTRGSTNDPDNFIYMLGFWNSWYWPDPYPYCTVTPDSINCVHDDVVGSSLMRWGNWDVVTYAANGNTNGVRWCTGPGAGNPACTTSETASTAPTFPGLSSPSKTLPASFYLAGKPSWFGSVPFPPIGPDVACGSNCNANTASHAAKIPAQLCYENTAKDANGYLTAFDADVCYYANPVPAVALSPASLDFGSQALGTTSAIKTVTLTNTGTAGLTLSTPALGITGDFAIAATTCTNGATVAATATCTISVTFTPTASGGRTGALSISDNASGSPQTASLSGTGGTAAPDAGPVSDSKPSPDHLIVVGDNGNPVVIDFSPGPDASPVPGDGATSQQRDSQSDAGKLSGGCGCMIGEAAADRSQSRIAGLLAGLLALAFGLWKSRRS